MRERYNRTHKTAKLRGFGSSSISFVGNSFHSSIYYISPLFVLSLLCQSFMHIIKSTFYLFCHIPSTSSTDGFDSVTNSPNCIYLMVVFMPHPNQFWSIFVDKNLLKSLCPQYRSKSVSGERGKLGWRFKKTPPFFGNFCC